MDEATTLEVAMTSRRVQWILWAIAMIVFLALALSGHAKLLGLAITAVALLWYGIVPVTGSRRQ